MPQRINVNVKGIVNLFLRVKNIVSRGIIKVSLDEKVIASKQEPRFVPAEMVNIALKKQELMVDGTAKIIVRIERDK